MYSLLVTPSSFKQDFGLLDKDDEIYLKTAIIANANFLITGNSKDFLAAKQLISLHKLRLGTDCSQISYIDRTYFVESFSQMIYRHAGVRFMKYSSPGNTRPPPPGPRQCPSYWSTSWGLLQRRLGHSE